MFGPALAAVAALGAAGVWLIPSGVFVPRTEHEADRAAPSDRPKAYEPERSNASWPLLASKLNDLREPWKGGPTDITKPTEVVPAPRLAWEYIGFVEGGGIRSAVVVINSQQRFVMEGERVSDPSWPNAEITVKSIDIERIKVSSNGSEETIPRKEPAPLALQSVPFAEGADHSSSGAEMMNGGHGVSAPGGGAIPTVTAPAGTKPVAGGRGAQPYRPGRPTPRKGPSNPIPEGAPGAPFTSPKGLPADAKGLEPGAVKPVPAPVNAVPRSSRP